MSGYAIILGGQLRNRGAQAMSMLAVSAVRRLMPGIEPVLVSRTDAPQPLASRLRGHRVQQDVDNLTFKVVWADPSLLPIDDGDARLSAKGRVKRALRGAAYARAMRAYEDLVADAAVCLDISGFTFGRQWGYERCQGYLNNIEHMERHGVPTYLLPQSFGPFDFSDSAQERDIRTRAGRLLLHPRMVCARERQGLEDVLSICPEARCTLEEDIVLQSDEVDPRDVFVDVSRVQTFPQIETSRNVGIVPNTRTLDQGDLASLLALYGSLVDGLLRDGYNVYVIQHSQDDAALCAKIKALHKDSPRVVLMGEDRYCFQYADLFERCDFLVASRYHAIVHAYRCGVPCVALGWATKYLELLDRLGQGEYVHDVRSLDDDAARGVFASVRRMEDRHSDEAETIRAHVAEIQSGQGVFERVADDLRGLQVR